MIIESLMDRLPDELVLVVFSFLLPSDFLILLDVCRKWQRLALDASLWRDKWCSVGRALKLIDKVPKEHVPHLCVAKRINENLLLKTYPKKVLQHAQRIKDTDSGSSIHWGHMLSFLNPQCLTHLDLRGSSPLFPKNVPWNVWETAKTAVFPHLKQLTVHVPLKCPDDIHRFLFFIRMAAQAPLLEEWCVLGDEEATPDFYERFELVMRDHPWWPASFPSLKRLTITCNPPFDYFPPCPVLQELTCYNPYFSWLLRLPPTMTHLNFAIVPLAMVNHWLKNLPRLTTCTFKSILGMGALHVPVSPVLTELNMGRVMYDFSWEPVLETGTVRTFSMDNTFDGEMAHAIEDTLKAYADKHGLSVYHDLCLGFHPFKPNQ